MHFFFFFHEANDLLFPVLMLPRHSRGSQQIAAAGFQMALAGRWHLLSELNSNTVSLADLWFYNVSELIFFVAIMQKRKMST